MSRSPQKHHHSGNMSPHLSFAFLRFPPQCEFLQAASKKCHPRNHRLPPPNHPGRPFKPCATSTRRSSSSSSSSSSSIEQCSAPHAPPSSSPVPCNNSPYTQPQPCFSPIHPPTHGCPLPSPPPSSFRPFQPPTNIRRFATTSSPLPFLCPPGPPRAFPSFPLLFPRGRTACASVSNITIVAHNSF